MAIALLQFLASAAVIVVAGAWLTRCADQIADHTGIGRLLIGSILLAGATSLPELTVDVNAIRYGMPDLAVGDLMGSSLFNLLILAVIDLTHHSRGRMLSRTAAAHALSGTASISMAALAAIGILVSQRWPQAMFGGIGVASWALLIAYALLVRLVFVDQSWSTRELPAASSAPAPHATGKLRWAVTGFLLAAGTLLVAGPFLAEAAGTLADLTGLGKTFVGSTLVALSTSLPELVATLTAVRMGAPDLAIGNVYGSNAFNMLLLFPLDVAHPGSLLTVVSPTHAITGLCTILITSVAVLGQLYQAERRIRFIEPDALLLIVMVVGSLALIYYLR